MANLEVSIGANPEQLGRDLARAQGMLQNFSRQVEKIGEIGDKLSDLGQKLTMYVTLPIAGLGVAAIKAYGDIEALQKGLEAVMGSAARASSEFDKLREVAKLPGLGLKEAAQGSVALQSAGFSAKKSRDALLAFGNALATVGKGANEMNFVILALTQLQNKATGFGQDLRQLMEQLPQLRGALTNAFGTSDSEAIAKTGATGAQVVEKLIQEFAKLPKVTGGIKNAFENLKDSIFINLSRIGDAINKNFNISEIIDKVTKVMDKLVSAFEDLSPGMQKTIIVVLALVAALGPLLVVLGGIMTALPILTAGLAALGTVLTVLIGVMGPELLLLGGLAVGIYKYATAAETATERQEKWSRSLEKATVSGQAEVAALDKLYAKTQDVNTSKEEQKRAVEEIQKQYPYYFQNIKEEIILAGKAAGTYDELRKSIMRAATARAAQAELDRREESRLKSELAIREKLNKVLQVYNNPTADNLAKLNKDLPLSEFISVPGGIIDQYSASADKVKKAVQSVAYGLINDIGKINKEFAKENKPILDIFKSGADDITKLSTEAGVKNATAVQGWKLKLEAKLKSLQEALDKAPTKSAAAKIGAQIKAIQKELSSIYPKEQEDKQLAEIFPKGSIEELRQRGELLKKAIESTSGDLIKLRKLDIYGHDKDKKGNPLYTGEVLTRQKANEELESINKQIKDKEYKSFEDRIKIAEEYYKGYYSLSRSAGKDIANVQYSGLIDTSLTFTEYLEKQKKALEDITLSGGILTDKQRSDLAFLSGKLEASNKTQVLDDFKNDLDDSLALLGTVADKVKYLKELGEKVSLTEGKSEYGVQMQKEIEDRNRKIIAEQNKFYKQFLAGKDNFSGSAIAIEEHFNNIRKKLSEDANITDAERTKQTQKTYDAQKKALQNASDDLNKEASKILNSGITSGIQDTLSSLFEALGSGGDALTNMGLSLLSSLGSIMMDLGKLAISTGVGLLAITTALKSLNPYVAIAAGAALVALGSVIKGSVSKLGSSGSGSSGGSVSTGTGANYSGQTYSSNFTSGGSGGSNEVIFRLAGPDLVGALNMAIARGNRLNSN